MIERVFFSRRMLVILLMGFSSGLPLALTGTTLQAWMTTEGIDLRVIGVFSLCTLPYTLKFLWAPFLDRYAPRFLGRRRGWMFISQVVLAFLLVMMSGVNPRSSLMLVALTSFLISFWSATQDVVVDAYRREISSAPELGAAASVSIFGYRLGMLTSGAVALALADVLPWPGVYRCMAGGMAVGLVATLLADEPAAEAFVPRTAVRMLVEPFKELLMRPMAMEVIGFALLYKLGDALAGALSTPFFLELGFTKTEVAAVLKGVGLTATIVGGLVGGAFMVRLGMKRSLLAFGVVQAASILAYAGLAAAGKSLPLMIVAVAIENLGAGLGTAAFVAFLMALCEKRYTASQYALLTAITAVLRVMLPPVSAVLIRQIDWMWFFLLSTVLSVPALVMVAVRYERWHNAAVLREES